MVEAHDLEHTTFVFFKDFNDNETAERSDATDGKAYHIDGTPAAESDKGIIIQDGKKSIQK